MSSDNNPVLDISRALKRNNDLIPRILNVYNITNGMIVGYIFTSSTALLVKYSKKHIDSKDKKLDWSIVTISFTLGLILMTYYIFSCKVPGEYRQNMPCPTGLAFSHIALFYTLFLFSFGSIITYVIDKPKDERIKAMKIIGSLGLMLSMVMMAVLLYTVSKSDVLVSARLQKEIKTPQELQKRLEQQHQRQQKLNKAKQSIQIGEGVFKAGEQLGKAVEQQYVQQAASPPLLGQPVGQPVSPQIGQQVLGQRVLGGRSASQIPTLG